MVDKVPKEITPAIANRGSTVHASDASTVGILSRGHLEEDISRVQSAILAFSATNDYKIGDLVIEAGTNYRANQAITASAFTLSEWDIVTPKNSAELASILSDETGSGAAVFATSPTLVTPDLGTPASGVLTNMTDLPVSGLADGTDGELITWDASGVADTVAVGTVDHVLTSNGAGAAPTFQDAGGTQTRTNITLTSDQAITATGDTDITGLTVTLPTVTGKFAIITFNINFSPDLNAKDALFKVSDNASIVNVFTSHLGVGGQLDGIRITYIASMAGQVVKAICNRDGGSDPTTTITILGFTPDGYQSSMQVLELA